MNNCYAILWIPDYIITPYGDYLRGYKKEFFNFTDTGFNTENVESMKAFLKNVYKIDNFDIHWTFLDPDHFCQLYDIK